MDSAAVIVPVVLTAFALFLILRGRIEDQVRCRITLNFRPYRLVEIGVPVERQEEFLRRLQFYSLRWDMMFGAYWTPKGEIGNDHEFLVVQSCNRHFNYHIENINEPARFRVQSMRNPRLRDDQVRPIFEDLIARLRESGFEVHDMPEPGGEPVPS